MAHSFISFFFAIFTLNSCFGFGAHADAVPYDYSYTPGCVGKPGGAQYNGGLVVNPEFNHGLKGWTAVGGAKIETAQSPDGNQYVVVHTAAAGALSQTFHMDEDKIYTVSAWVQVSRGKAKVQARLQTPTGTINQTGSWITAQSGCWKMLKGGFILNTTAPAHLLFQTDVAGVDILVDSVSLQPFTQQDWTSHQDDSRQKARKGNAKLELVDEKGQPIANATVFIRQRQPNFPFGAAINHLILDNSTYQTWFLDRFKYAVFQNELEWSATEKLRGLENYTVADAMLDFCKSNGVAVRGHNILTDNADHQRDWVLNLRPPELREAAFKRVNSVVSKYKGQFIHWDVINDNMHWNFFSKLDPVAGKFDAGVFNLTHRVDPIPILFLNEYNVIEHSSINGSASPSVYLDKIDEIRRAGYRGPLGIGLQSHFDSAAPNIAYIRASIDMLASTGLPIWITEFDVNFKTLPNPSENLEMLLREFHSHAAVGGIMLWSAMSAEGGCRAMCLTNPDYTSNPAGDLVDKFMSDFIKIGDSNRTTDANGVFEASLFHGEYEANVTLANGIQCSDSKTSFSIVPGGKPITVELKCNA